MAKIIHVAVSLRHLRLHLRDKADDEPFPLLTFDGEPVTVAEARQYVEDVKDAGYDVIPPCEDYYRPGDEDLGSHTVGSCRGHLKKTT
jgi:hypothetical protein